MNDSILGNLAFALVWGPIIAAGIVLKVYQTHAWILLLAPPAYWTASQYAALQFNSRLTRALFLLAFTILLLVIGAYI